MADYKDGRKRIMREVLDSLSPEGKAELAEAIEFLRSRLRERSVAETGVDTRFPPDDVFELLWELLIFTDDPSAVGRERKIAKYTWAAKSFNRRSISPDL